MCRCCSGWVGAGKALACSRFSAATVCLRSSLSDATCARVSGRRTVHGFARFSPPAPSIRPGGAARRLGDSSVFSRKGWAHASQFAELTEHE
eukprot:SAG11_NODE_12077_length_723_cov_0.681090_2_plen_92_part_00